MVHASLLVPGSPWGTTGKSLADRERVPWASSYVAHPPDVCVTNAESLELQCIANVLRW